VIDLLDHRADPAVALDCRIIYGALSADAARLKKHRLPSVITDLPRWGLHESQRNRRHVIQQINHGISTGMLFLIVGNHL